MAGVPLNVRQSERNDTKEEPARDGGRRRGGGLFVTVHSRRACLSLSGDGAKISTADSVLIRHGHGKPTSIIGTDEKVRTLRTESLY